MNFLLFLIGIVFSVGSVYLYDYLNKIHFLKNKFVENPYITYDLALLLASLLVVYFIYYFFILIGLNKYKKEFKYLNETFLNFLKDRKTTFNTKDRFLFPMYETFNIFKNQFVELEKFYAEKRKELQQTKSEITEVLNMQNSLIFKVTQEGKILDANTKALKFLGYTSLAELNKKYSNLSQVFENDLEVDWIGKNIAKTLEVNIFKRTFEMFLDKVPAQQEFMVSLRDITVQRENLDKLIKLAYYNEQTDLKNINMIDKQKRSVLIKIYNYDDYARVMSEEIMSLFIVEFSNRIKKLDFEDVYRLSNDTFALSLNEEIDLKELKTSLEKSITIFIGGQKYLFNAILLLSEGITYEKAKKALVEAKDSLMPLYDRNIEEIDISALNMLNEAMFENRIYISYKQMTSLKTREMIFYIEPVIKEKFTGEAIFDKNVIKLSKRLNFYLKMVKNGLLNNIDKLVNKKVFIDVDDSDMFYQDDFVELIRLLKKENLKAIFNISIHKNYKFAYERIKILKKYGFEISFNNIGSSYFKIKDIYALKVDYLMLDDEIISLIKNDNRWEFILDHIEGIVSYQNTSVISKSLNRGDFFIDDEVYLFN
jgi:EAL domain-containing protein (putative c-di-GMP-specific phosphodiesterase class I)/PAS domain-containing protein